MNQNYLRRGLTSALLAVTILFSSIAQARPMPGPFELLPEDAKLPPVNWIRSRKIDVKHLLIDLRFNWEKQQALGVTTVTLAPFNDTNTITLDAAAMTINSVTSPNGKALNFNYKGGDTNDNLEITLDRTYKSGEDVSVKIDYTTNYVNKADDETAIGSFGRGLRFIIPAADEPGKPKQIWSQGETEFNRYWFPSYDSPNDFRTTELLATVEKPYFVVSNGKLVSTKENSDGTRTFDWKMEQPYSNYLTSIVVTTTAPVEQNADGIPVYNFGYPNETKEVAATVKNLPATIKFFGEITGVKYPYPKYSQAFVEDFGGGMENISATTQIEEMIHDERELLDQDSEGLQSHELAHQWFGDYVTCRDWGQIWLNESFATYMQAMWTEKLKGYDEFLYSDVRNNHGQVLGSWEAGQRRPIVTKYYESKDALFDNYAYPGGASVLHMLRKHLGDKLFFKSLNNYLTTNAHQPVSTEDLRIAVEETSGQSMDWFFDEWLYRMGHPVFDITQSYDDTKKQLTLNVKQTQKIDVTNAYPQTEFFQSFVDVEIDNKIERVWMEPKETNVFTFNVTAKPKLVSWDYESTLLSEMKFDKPVDELLYQMANDEDPLGRRWAMAELEVKAATTAVSSTSSIASQDRARIITAMTTSAEKDPFWRIRRAALSVIANLYSPDPDPGKERPAFKLDGPTEQAIIRLTKDKEGIIRGEAMELLGETQDKKYAELFLPALNDQSYEVIDQASLALARVKDPRAFDALNKLTTVKSWKGRVAIAGLNGLAELGDKRAFETGLKFANDASQPRIIRTAALSIVGSTGKGDPRAYPLIFAQFKKAFDANSVPNLINSIRAIIKIGDPRGQEAFDMLKVKFKDNPGALQAIGTYETEFKAAIGK